MRSKLFSVAFLGMLLLATMPQVMAGTTITDVTWTPLHPKQGDTIHVKAKVTVTENITYARVLNCWEKPTYTCGFPKDMTDPDKDGYYEADLNNTAWTNGNIVHLNISITVKSGTETAYTIPPITIGASGGPSDYTTETDCKKAGYFWWYLDDACHDKAVQPADYKTKTACENVGYFWWDGKCNAAKGTPEKYIDKASCENTTISYFWYDNKCNAEKKKTNGKPPIPGFETAVVFSALAIAGLALLGTRSRKKN